MNHADGGFDCPGCAWADDPTGLHLDICENGIKHAPGRFRAAKADRDFFAAHTVSELAGGATSRSKQGRLAEPLLYNAETDKYVPISWEDAFELVGETLRGSGEPAPGVVLHLRAGSATRRRSSISCGCASSAPTTCRTARTCATRRAAGR